jgi:hypothetical protein
VPDRAHYILCDRHEPDPDDDMDDEDWDISEADFGHFVDLYEEKSRRSREEPTEDQVNGDYFNEMWAED